MQIEGRPIEGYYEYFQTWIGGNSVFCIPECLLNVTLYYFSVVQLGLSVCQAGQGGGL